MAEKSFMYRFEGKQIYVTNGNIALRKELHPRQKIQMAIFDH